MDSVASRLVAVGNNAFQQEETKVLLIVILCEFYGGNFKASTCALCHQVCLLVAQLSRK